MKHFGDRQIHLMGFIQKKVVIEKVIYETGSAHQL